MSNDKFIYPKSGIIIRVRDDFDEVLRHCLSVGKFSDVYVIQELGIVVKSYGANYPVVSRSIDETEMRSIVEIVTKDSSGFSYILSAQEYDGSYSHYAVSGDVRSSMVRYRVNGIAMLTRRGTKGAQITMRSIEFCPPPISTMDFEPAILENLFIRNGLVVFAGVTGSGKSTAIASALRHIVEQPNSNQIINTYEAPIEYIHEGTYAKDPSSYIFQTEVNEVGGMVKTFAKGLRASLRRNPTGIVVGESRDYETIEASITASNAGCWVYTTLHANSPGDVVNRIVNMFPASEKIARYYELISNLRLIVVQFLAPSTDGKRTPIRSYIAFDDALREKLKRTNFQDAETVISEFMVSEGSYRGARCQGIRHSAKYKLDAGLITPAMYEHILTGA